MARQYIGAKYVPTFYEGSSGNDWEAGHSYEPLTIVTYLNDSYTSKKQVPSSVGDPASNPDYWVLTGQYNSQISQLTSDVSDLQNDVNTLDTRTQQRSFTVTADGVKTYGQLMDELYNLTHDFVDSLDAYSKHRLKLSTPYGAWYISAISSSVLEFYGVHNIPDAGDQMTQFAFKLQSSGSHVFRVKTNFAVSPSVTTIEGWTNSVPAIPDAQFILFLI